MSAIEDLVKALYGLGEVHRAMAREAFAELGSNGFTALSVVYAHGPLRVSDVADRLGVDISVASRQLGALLAAGYVHRDADEVDRRAWHVTVTEAGTCVLRECHRRLVDAFAATLDGWSEGDVAALATGLTALRDDYRAKLDAAQALGVAQ